MGNRIHNDISFEMLVEALEHSQGFFCHAQSFLKKKYNHDISHATMKHRVKMFDLTDWVEDLRRKNVEIALKKTYKKALEDGDNQCLQWILNRWMHHVDYLEEKTTTEPESKKGWKEILEVLKRETATDLNG